MCPSCIIVAVLFATLGISVTANQGLVIGAICIATSAILFRYLYKKAKQKCEDKECYIAFDKALKKHKKTIDHLED